MSDSRKQPWHSVTCSQSKGTTKEKVLKGSDWVLIWSWAVFVLFLGPFLISARDSLMVFVGFGILAALIYFTQRRIVPIIQEKIK